MARRRISGQELRVGSVLEWDVYDDAGRLLLRRGHIVASENQIEALLARGLYTQAEPPRTPAPPPSGSAVALVLDARERLEAACAEGRSIDGFAARVLAIRRLIAHACDLSADAALAMTLLARVGRYSIRHSVDVALACEVVGRAAGLGERELDAAVAGALTMNIAMLELQDELQSQEAALTPVQQEAVRLHPEVGAAMLRERGVEDPLWLDTVAAHHEAFDGSGYKQARGDDIPAPAQLVYLADIYCARISSRTYRAPLTPHAALRALFAEQGRKVRQDLASAFIHAIGVFPSGTPVRLANGEVAVVVGRGANVKTPCVCAIRDSNGMPLVRPMKRDTAQPGFTVRDVITWAELGPPPPMNWLWGRVAEVR